MTKVRGFLMLESMLAILITFLGLMLFSLVVGESEKIEHHSELRADRILAWKMMHQNHLNQVTIHNRVYQINGSDALPEVKEN